MGCNATVVAAFQQGQLGFALSDAGWLMPWYFGVMYALQKLGIVTPGVTPVGGVSGGSVAAASSCLGLDFPTQVMPAVQDVAATCRSSKTCAGKLHSMMDPALDSLLLPAASNATALARCKANTEIYVSVGQPVITYQPGSLLLGQRASLQITGSKAELIGKSNAEDFVNGIIANWFIPYNWSKRGNWSTSYRGQPAYEGYFTKPMPCPSNAKLCIRLSSRYPGALCAKDKLYDIFVRPFYLTPKQPLYPQPADIHPGKYNSCKYTPMELSAKLAITPGSREDLQYLFDLGKADGAAWAAEVGLTNPAACAAAAPAVADVADAVPAAIAAGADAADAVPAAAAAGKEVAAAAGVGEAAGGDAAAADTAVGW